MSEDHARELKLLALIMRHVAKLSPAGRTWLRQQLEANGRSQADERDVFDRLRAGVNEPSSP